MRFSQFVYNRLRELTEVVIDESTCMAQDSANKVIIFITNSLIIVYTYMYMQRSLLKLA